MKISSSIPVLGSGSNKSDDPSSSSETSNALQDTANQKKIQGLPPLSPVSYHFHYSWTNWYIIHHYSYTSLSISFLLPFLPMKFLSKKKATVEPAKPKNVSSDSNSDISTQQNGQQPDSDNDKENIPQPATLKESTLSTLQTQKVQVKWHRHRHRNRTREYRWCFHSRWWFVRFEVLYIIRVIIGRKYTLQYNARVIGQK